MVFNDIDCNCGNGNVIVEHSPKESSALDVSVEEFCSYFHITGEIKDSGATAILPKAAYCKKKYCTLLDDVQHTSWPNVLNCHHHDVYYNLNSSCEELEANVYKLVKFDTNSLSSKRFANSSTDCTAEEKEMVHNKKRNICELLFTSPERRKLSIESNDKKFKEIQRCNISNTSQVRQIALVTGKKNGRKKSIKGCFQTNLKLNFNAETNSAPTSCPLEPGVSSRSCRKSLFKTQMSPHAIGTSSNSEINPNMSIDWSIKKNRPAARKRTKPILTLNAEKCISPSNENKYKLSLRKGLQRTMFLNGDCNMNDKKNNEEKDLDSSNSERKSLCRFDSMSSEDTEKFGQVERLPGDLSDRHKKKLREAVANALETHGIHLDHPSFKAYGRNLFAICRNQLKDVIRKGRTSIQMKQLAESHVEKVIRKEATMDKL